MEQGEHGPASADDKHSCSSKEYTRAQRKAGTDILEVELCVLYTFMDFPIALIFPFPFISFPFSFFLLLFFFKVRVLEPGCPGTPYVVQTGLPEILLPLPLEVYDYLRVCLCAHITCEGGVQVETP